jgi:hypothetical protein
MRHPSHAEKAVHWMHRFRRNARSIIKNTLAAGTAVFIISYGGLYLAIQLFPDLFVAYISPVFNSDGSRDVYFYMHPYVLALSLSVFWSRFGRVFEGNRFQIAAEFSVTYTFVALIPIMWITYSAMDVGLQMVATWIIYGLFQAFIAGYCLTVMQPMEPEIEESTNAS